MSGALLEIEDYDMTMEVETTTDMTEMTGSDGELECMMSGLSISAGHAGKFRQGQVLAGRSDKRQLRVKPPVLDPKSRVIKKQAGKWSPARKIRVQGTPGKLYFHY